MERPRRKRKRPEAGDFLTAGGGNVVCGHGQRIVEDGSGACPVELDRGAESVEKDPVREWQRQPVQIASCGGCGGLFFGVGIHTRGKQEVQIVRTPAGHWNEREKQ